MLAEDMKLLSDTDGRLLLTATAVSESQLICTSSPSPAPTGDMKRPELCYCTQSGLHYRRGSLSLENSSILQVRNMSVLCSGERDLIILEGKPCLLLTSANRHCIFHVCKQNCPLLQREVPVCHPRLFAIETSLKREFRTKDSQCLIRNICGNARDPWRMISR